MGVVVNIALLAVKFIIGLISHSISITADAIHNLTNATSSLVTIIGFKMASKPADKEYPFGHERIANLTVINFQWISFIIMVQEIHLHQYMQLAEVPCTISLIDLTETIDKAEAVISKNLNIYMVIHIDSVKKN